VCTDPTDSVVIGSLARALVESTAADWAAGLPTPRWRSEELRVAQWRASRFGMADALVHPLTRELRPAGEVVDALLVTIAPALEEAGDLDGVSRALQRGVSGNGATRQRAAYERAGHVAGVVDDLIARTEEPREAPFGAPAGAERT